MDSSAAPPHTGFGDCACLNCNPDDREPLPPLAKPPWHGNWARTWSLGPFSFEIEWTPRARQYGFYLSIDFSGGRYDD